MKRAIISAVFVAMSIAAFAQNLSTERLLLDGWRFHQGRQPGAEVPDFDDASWQKVTIPHDWAIAGPFDKEIDKQVVAIVQDGETKATEKTGRTGALPWLGEGWYRMSLNIPEGYSHAELQFDGAMAEPTVYLDGKKVAYWANGYNVFTADISAVLPRGGATGRMLTPGTHCLAVHLQNVEESSRWYPGAGLYRPVRLLLGQETGIKTFGTFARATTIQGIDKEGRTAASARLAVTTHLRVAANSGKLKVVLNLEDAAGRVVASCEAPANSSERTDQVLVVPNPKLWSPERPVLYTLVSELCRDTKILDRQETPVGIRKIEYGPEGFALNGVIRKFKGVCLHHDLGPLGAAFNKAAFRRQVALLKEIGCDAIRTSHNFPAPWQMDICDEMGMMVMAESFDMWKFPKCKNGYSRFFEFWWEKDLEHLVLVNRNHPSIVMWSIGNEIPEQRSEAGLIYTLALQNLAHRLDPTRPCTQGIDMADQAISNSILQQMDIPGLNYRLHMYEAALKNSRGGFVLGSETASTVSSRGVYKFPVEEVKGKKYDDGQGSSYDLSACPWSNIPDDDWMWQDKAPWVIGEFVWTGFDYLGEPTPYNEFWPSRSSYFGLYDLAGLPKDRVALYRSRWASEKKTIHILPHWTWKGRDGQVTPVFVYTNYPEAELFINGKSQGRRHKADLSLEDYIGNTAGVANRLDRYRLRWMDTVYESGELKAVAYDENGNVAGEAVVRTAGKPHHIELIADRSVLNATPQYADGFGSSDTPDLSFVTVRILDKDGNLCPDASNQVTFSVSGTSDASFNSCCNGDPTSLEIFHNPSMQAFHGQLVAVVQAGVKPGDAVLTVKSKGLKPATISLKIVEGK